MTFTTHRELLQHVERERDRLRDENARWRDLFERALLALSQHDAHMADYLASIAPTVDRRCHCGSLEDHPIHHAQFGHHFAPQPPQD